MRDFSILAGNRVILSALKVLLMLLNSEKKLLSLVRLKIQSVRFLYEGLMHDVIFNACKSDLFFFICIKLLKVTRLVILSIMS